jgi:hypothetical protein
MANIPIKKKGAPPALTETVSNLDRPDPAELAPLNFKVPNDFKRELKTYAAQRGISMVKILMEGFDLYKQHHGS